MRRFFFLFLLELGVCCLSFAQPVLTRTGSYTYVVPPDQSLDVAKKKALESAKNQILADEFGTVVGVSSISRTENIDGQSKSSYLSIGETDVKGEWIGTVGTPSYEMSFEGEMMVIKVTVTGKIREITSSSIDLDVRVLRNGVDERSESGLLRHDDDFFLLFKSPVKGYVAVYQYDSDGVFRLLPYMESETGSVPVKGGKEYVFFEENSQSGVTLKSEMPAGAKAGSHYMISCSSAEDLCRYYVIFSPNAFSVPNDEKVNDSTPAMIDFESFQKWIVKSRKQDKEMVVVPRDVTLRKK